MYHRFATTLCFLLVLLAGCQSTPNIYIDSDPEQDFSVYRTFTWTHENPMIVTGSYLVSPFVKQQVMDSIKRNLTEKGYKFVDDLAQADFAIAFTIGARDLIKPQQQPAVFYGDWRWGARYFGPPVIVYTDIKYTQGVLSIDAFDVKRRSPVWHGVGKKRLRDSDLKDDLTAVDSAVSTILKGF